MRIEGAIALAGMAAQQGSDQEIQGQRKESQAAMASGNARDAVAHGSDAKPVGHQVLEQAVGQVAKLVNTFNESLHFKIHEGTHTTVISVVNQDTGEVIRQIPSEKFLDMIAMFQKQLSGLLVDTNR